ncbi:MAG: hypothetical protein P0107_06310, partial [Nitrosomonas sp.]|nr:hypothetical protein [Nitrosomonas sp.]
TCFGKQGALKNISVPQGLVSQPLSATDSPNLQAAVPVSFRFWPNQHQAHVWSEVESVSTH